MRIAKGNVRHGDCAAARPGSTQFIFRTGNALVGERGPANRAKMLELYNQPFALPVKIRNVLKRATFAFLGALAVAGVQQRDVGSAMAFARDRCADARVHAAAKKHHSLSLIRSCRDFHRSVSLPSSVSNTLCGRIPNELV